MWCMRKIRWHMKKEHTELGKLLVTKRGGSVRERERERKKEFTYVSFHVKMVKENNVLYHKRVYHAKLLTDKICVLRIRVSEWVFVRVYGSWVNLLHCFTCLYVCSFVSTIYLKIIGSAMRETVFPCFSISSLIKYVCLCVCALFVPLSFCFIFNCNWNGKLFEMSSLHL